MANRIDLANKAEVDALRLELRNALNGFSVLPYRISDGPPTDAPEDGHLPTIDTTNSRLYIRANGAWRYTELGDVDLGLTAEQLAALASVASKADQADVDEALALKADQADVAAALATKVNSSTYTSGMASKADNAALDAEVQARQTGDAGALAAVANEATARAAADALKADLINGEVDPAQLPDFATSADVAAVALSQEQLDLIADVPGKAETVSFPINFTYPGYGGIQNGNDWGPALTAAAAAAGAKGGKVYVPAETFPVATAPAIPNGVTFEGEGIGSRFAWYGAGNFATLTNARNIKFLKLRVTLTAAGQTAFYLHNTFRCSWFEATVDGQHVAATGATYRTQVGWQFRGNSGDNRIFDCDINNLGEAVQADTIMNYFNGCIFGNNWRSIHVDAGSYAGGMNVQACTFVGTTIGAAAVDCHFLVSVPANQSSIDNCWFEGCTDAVRAGSNTGTVGGPVGMSITNTKLAATNKCLDIKAGRQFRLDNIRFSADPGATPTEITVDSTNAVDGFAANLLSATGYDVATSVFPPKWHYFPRSEEDTQIATRSLRVGQGLANGQPSFFYAGNGRARIGYDGTRTVLSDAGGGRDVALVAGSTPRQLVTAAADGNVYIGNKLSTTGSGVVTIGIQNAVTLPSVNPVGGGVLYVENGALKYRGSSGTVTTIGPA